MGRKLVNQERRIKASSSKRSDTQKMEDPMKQADAGVKTDRYSEIPIELIEVESNIRQKYNPESDEGKQETKKIHELADSLRQTGQLEPILVYEKTKDNYVIITGHRRFAAARYAGLPTIRCIIREKPKSEVDRLYIQAIENEQRENISPADRERYIANLINAGQTKTSICEKMGKSAGWISQTVKAKEGRETFGSKFTQANIDLDTYAAYQIAGATEAAIDRAIQAIQTNPKKRKAILKDVERSKERTTTRGRPKKIAVADSIAEPVQDAVMPIIKYVLGYRISINEKTKLVTIENPQQSQFNELMRGLLHKLNAINFTETIDSYFREKGYAIEFLSKLD